jgi:transcriptional regulator with XRE-family HTH domain
MSAWRLDTERIRRLCGEHRMSMRQLGDSIGSSAQRIEHLLQGTGSVEHLTLRELMRLGERLGVDGIDLVVASHRKAQVADLASDTIKLHAVLARLDYSITRRELAEVLGWELRRTNLAILALSEKLADTGELIHHVSSSSVVLRARDSVLSDTERSRAERVPLNRKGLDRRTARVLLRLLRNGGEATAAENKSRLFERRTIIKHGIAVVGPSGTLRMHPDVVFSLGLEDG